MFLCGTLQMLWSQEPDSHKQSSGKPGAVRHQLYRGTCGFFAGAGGLLLFLHRKIIGYMA